MERFFHSRYQVLCGDEIFRSFYHYLVTTLTMLRLARWIYQISVLSIIGLVFMLGWRVWSIDLAQIKSEMELAFNQQTGFFMEVGGEVERKVFPSLSVIAHDIRVYSEEGGQVLATIESGEFNAAWLPLLRREVRPSKAQLKGVYIRYSPAVELHRDLSKKFWHLASNGAGEVRRSPTAKGRWRFDMRQINRLFWYDSLVEYYDAAGQQNGLIAAKYLKLSDFNSEKRSAKFDLDVQIRHRDRLAVSFDGDGEFTIEPKGHRLAMQGLDAEVAISTLSTTVLDTGTETSVSMLAKLIGQYTIEADRVHWQIDSEKLQMQGLSLVSIDRDDISARADIQAQFGKAPQWEAVIQLKKANAKSVVAWLPEMMRPAIVGLSERVGPAAVSASGNREQIRLSNIDAKVGSSQISGFMTFQRDNDAQARFDLRVDKLDFRDSQQGRGLLPHDAQAEILPLDWFSAHQMAGNIHIGKLEVGKQQYSNIRCELSAIRVVRSKTLDCRLRTWKNAADIQLEIDFGQPQPQINFNVAAQSAPIETLLQSLSGQFHGMAQGSLAGTAILTTRGNTVDQWLRQLNGNVSLDIDQGRIRDFSPKAVIIRDLQAGRVTDADQLIDLTLGRWTLSNNTYFKLNDTKTNGRISNGVLQLKNWQLSSLEGDHISSDVAIRFVDHVFQATAQAKLRDTQSHETLGSYAWPITCQGKLGQQSLAQQCALSADRVAHKFASILQKRATSATESAVSSGIQEAISPTMPDGRE